MLDVDFVVIWDPEALNELGQTADGRPYKPRGASDSVGRGIRTGEPGGTHDGTYFLESNFTNRHVAHDPPLDVRDDHVPGDRLEHLAQAAHACFPSVFLDDDIDCFVCKFQATTDEATLSHDGWQ